MKDGTVLGPVPCQICRRPVIWNGKRWRDPGQRSGKHVCAQVRAA